ncbi:hypothetical protein HB943_14880, partial [Listeria weihenstephanensis]
KRIVVNVKEAPTNAHALTAQEYYLGSAFITGTYDKEATKVVLYVDGKAVKNSTLDLATMTYKAAAKSFITNASQKVEMVMSKGTKELKRVTVKVSTNDILTANPYILGEKYVTGTYSNGASKVVLYVDGKAMKNSTLDPAKTIYYVSAKGFITSKTQNVELVMSKGTKELKRVKLVINDTPTKNAY